MSEEIIEIFENGMLERREMILEHLEKLKSVEVLKMSHSLQEVLNGYERGRLERRKKSVDVVNELADYVQKERLYVLNLCLPEAKEK